MSLLMVMGLIALTAHTGYLPHQNAATPTSMQKASLLAHLPEVTSVGYDQDALMLFDGKTPLMVVWMSSNPAELWSVQGEFISQLNQHDMRRIMTVTSAVIRQNEQGAPQRDERRDSELRQI